MNKLLIALSSIVLLLLSSCKDKITNPPDDTPGRRDYTWTVDTVLNNPWDSAYRLWASSPTDIWVTGWGGGAANSIWHFDGSRWDTVDYTIYYGPRGIYGFAKGDIYIGFMNGGIWHFDGNNFRQVYLLTMPPPAALSFENIWGASPNDIYAVGAHTDQNGYANCPVIAHFVNGIWDTLSTDGIRGEVEHLYEDEGDNKIYLQTITALSKYPDTTYIYQYAQDKYALLYRSLSTRGLQADISLIDGQVYFILGNQIAVHINNQFQTLLTVDNPNFCQRIWGRNGKDIFLMMTDGLAHYNGTNIQYLIHYGSPTQIYGASLFDHDVFFLINDPHRLSLVYHGTLKE